MNEIISSRGPERIDVTIVERGCPFYDDPQVAFESPHFELGALDAQVVINKARGGVLLLNTTECFGIATLSTIFGATAELEPEDRPHIICMFDEPGHTSVLIGIIEGAGRRRLTYEVTL